MTTEVQRRRGTTAEHASFTGAVGEITVDTTKLTAVVHDGSTAGGHPLLKEAALDTDDTLAADSDTKVATQQATKAHVANAVSGLASSSSVTSAIAAAVAALIDSAPSNLDTLNEIAAAINDDPNFHATLTSALALKAPLASPTLTGTPAAPTAASGTDTTQIATTAFVQDAVSAAISAGDIKITFDEAPLAGFVELDGSTIADGAIDYPALAARYAWMVVGNDIELPDVRGRFLRSWANGSSQDPNRSSRGDRAGDNEDGDVVGTYQSDQFLAHTHTETRPAAVAAGTLSGNSINAGSVGSFLTSSSGGSETRPTNINVLVQMWLG